MRSPRDLSDHLQSRARGLRRTQSEPEAIVWAALRDRQLHGFKFRRQHPLGAFVVDFYCAEARLVVELDGPSHVGREDYDQRRQSWLEEQGLRVLRFTNDQVRQSLGEVLDLLGAACRQRRAGAR
jgi:very-short-patch-repair endonuclease